MFKKLLKAGYFFKKPHTKNQIQHPQQAHGEM